MKYYCFTILTIFLLSCGPAPKKHMHFACITPFGVAQADSDDPNLTVYADTLSVKQDDKIIVIHRNQCMEFID